MHQNIGVWIDHQRAILVSSASDQIETLQSGVDGHPRYSGRDGGGERHYEQRRQEQLDRYYDDVIAHLHPAAELFLFGPGEAKRELHKRLGRSRAMAACIVHTASADDLTIPQIVATVKEFFHPATTQRWLPQR